MTKLTAYAQEAEEAIRTLLATLLGTSPGLTTATPAVAAAPDVKAAAEGRLLLHSAEPLFMVALDAGWVELLSEAMLGTPMTADDEGAADLVSEVAAQGYGAVQSALAAAGAQLPSATFACHLPGENAPLPDDASWAVPFEAQDGALRGVVFLPTLSTTGTRDEASAATAAPEAAAPEPAPVAPAAFAELGDEAISGDGGGPGNLGLLAEVELEVTAELGRRRLPLADMLKLTTGSVIELEKLVGEPLAVYANGHLIAEGEAVVIDEQFGIRITNLASKAQRDKAFF